MNFEFFVTSRIMFDLFCASYRVSAGNIGYSDSFVLLGRGYIDRGVQTLLLSLPKKVLVTLIHFLCSFISVARRTNPEAPPQLSGLTVYRYGRCWGCGTRICSNSSRPLSSVSLAFSPPDKGGDFSRAFDSLSNPSVFQHSFYISLRKHCFPCRYFLIPLLINPSVTACHLPYILLRKTPRNTTGHGREEGESNPLFIAVKCTYIALRHPAMLRGTTGWSFIFLFYYCV